MPIRPFLLTFALVATVGAQTTAPAQPGVNPAIPASATPPAQQATPPAQPTTPPAQPGSLAAAARPAEPALDALTRTGPEAIALKLAAGKSLLLHSFDFNGDPVPAAKIHLRQLAPGIFELTSLAYAPGVWHFQLTDTASYYGLGEHFDTLDHAHTIVRNAVIYPALDSVPRGSSTSRPAPFFLSTSGYALALDLPFPQAETPASPPDAPPNATFDLNASDRTEISIDVSTTRLRILLFTGTPAAPGRFPALLTQLLTTLKPPSASATVVPMPLPSALTGALAAELAGLPPTPLSTGGSHADGGPVIPPDAPLARFYEFQAFSLLGPGCPVAGPDAELCARYGAIFRSLVQYRTTAESAAAATHQPLLRPLFLDFQDDLQARAITDEYLLGPSLLVAPVLDSNTSRPVYLPAGPWRNVFTGESFTGPTRILAAVPLDTIPVFARPDFTIPRDFPAALTPATAPAPSATPAAR